MAKDKKKKKSKKKGVVAAVSSSKTAKTLKSLSDNPLVADVVAAALVATASALKDAKKAQRLAASAGEELEKLSKKGARQGSAMWQLALDVGRHALATLSDEIAPKASKTAKPAKAAKDARAPRAAKSASSPKRTSRKSSAKPVRKSRS